MTFLFALIACSSPPDIDLTGPSHDRPQGSSPASCVRITVDRIQQRGVSSPSMAERNTRMYGHTEDGRTVAWDFSRALWQGPPLAGGDTLFLLVAEDGSHAGITRTCPVDPTATTP